MKVIHIQSKETKTVERETEKMYFFTDGKRALKKNCKIFDFVPIDLNHVKSLNPYDEETIYVFPPELEYIEVCYFLNEVGPFPEDSNFKVEKLKYDRKYNDKLQELHKIFKKAGYKVESEVFIDGNGEIYLKCTLENFSKV